MSATTMYQSQSGGRSVSVLTIVSSTGKGQLTPNYKREIFFDMTFQPCGHFQFRLPHIFAWVSYVRVKWHLENFPETTPQFLWIIHRPTHELFACNYSPQKKELLFNVFTIRFADCLNSKETVSFPRHFPFKSYKCHFSMKWAAETNFQPPPLFPHFKGGYDILGQPPQVVIVWPIYP